MPISRRSWSGEDGIALVLAMFMVLVVSLLGASLAGVGRTETLSSLNYKTMSQARYAAESGLHSAANYLIHTYQPPGVDGGDPLANYDMTVSPVEYNGNPVVLTTADGGASNYPIENKIDAFVDDSKGELVMATTNASYTATATLLSMRSFPDAYSGGDVTIQKWLITGLGSIDGAGAADVQVSAIIETQAVPAYRYAAFAAKNQCDAMSFAGGAVTDSYDSSDVAAGFEKEGGDVGTNGSLTLNGAKSTIQGTLSTPREGVGNCEDGAVNALDAKNELGVTEGLVKLPQEVTWNTPAVIDPAPPVGKIEFKKGQGCPAGAGATCAANGSGEAVFTPVGKTPVQLGDVEANALAVIHLNAGIYEVNSLKLLANSQLKIDSGPVIIRVNGKDGSGNDLAAPITIASNTILNGSLNPQNLQLVYGGDAKITITGGAATALLTYAPNATVELAGNSDFYGATVGATVNVTGSSKIHYDVNLKGWAYTEGAPTMTSFTWSSTD